ncbi:hypothetical protein CCP3SC5AM1_160003 [Gammaproteobacteria bacterium]
MLTIKIGIYIITKVKYSTNFLEAGMVILVGADRLGNIEQLLKDRGYNDAMHIAGRNPGAQRKMAGALGKARLMVLFTDFIGHNVARNFKQMAKDHGLPFVACRRSTVSLVQALDRIQTSDCSDCNGCGQFVPEDNGAARGAAKKVKTHQISLLV